MEIKQRQSMEQIKAYGRYLAREERSAATIEKYLRDVGAFFAWLPTDKAVEKEAVLAYKEKIRGEYAAASVNSMLAAVNGFLKFIGRTDCAVKTVRTQRRLYCSQERELTRAEYLRLVEASKRRGNRRLSLILQTICATGIRVSELRFITVEAARRGRAEVRCKGKQRTVFLPRQLCKQLQSYLREKCAAEGPVFVTRSGRPLDRSNIWSDMKRLCKGAGVAESKVFPHNLRHLFARTFYAADKDISRLADLLGHSSIDTTRIYMISAGREHIRKIERLGLVV